jgi:hypothetical protein
MSHLLRTLAAASVVALFTAGAPAPAHAKLPANWALNEDGSHGFNLFAHGFVEGSPSFGGGVLAGIPIPPNGTGFIPSTNDAFFIEVGGQFGGVLLSGPTVEFMGGAKYRIHLFDWMAPYAFARGGVGMLFVPGATVPPVPFPVVQGGLGIVFTVHEVIGIRLEGGYPGFRAGVNFELP